MRTSRSIVLLALLSLVVALAAACGGEDEQAEPAGQPTEEPAAEEEPLTIGFVTHVKGNPFIEQIIDGARAAADDLGVTLEVAGPEGFDPDAQLKIIQDLVAAGANGVATSVPGESMANGLNELIESGTPVVQFNLLSTSVEGPYVGERSTESGRILGRKIAEQLEGGGTAVLGICAPGFPVLENRANGVKEGLGEAEGIEVLGPFDVKVDPAENFARWEQQLAANSDAKAMIGLCAPDVASLGKLNAANADKLVVGGYDTTAENLQAIADGHAYVTLGQAPFVQGYLPVKMIVDHLRDGAELPAGFLESGTEVVTKDDVTMPHDLPALTFDELLELAESPEKTREYWTPLVTESGKFADWTDDLEPVENEAK